MQGNQSGYVWLIGRWEYFSILTTPACLILAPTYWPLLSLGLSKSGRSKVWWCTGDWATQWLFTSDGVSRLGLGLETRFLESRPRRISSSSSRDFA